MIDLIPEPGWTLAQSELAQIWVAQVLVVHGQFVWAIIEIRNHGSEQLLVDLTPDDVPQLRLRSASPLVGGIGRSFDPERRQTVAKLRASQGVVARQLAPGERWRVYSEPLEREYLDDARFVKWFVRGSMTLLVGAQAQAFQWASSVMPWPPELRLALQPPPPAGREDPNPETLSALLHDRLDELEPTRVGVGVATRNLQFWLWGFKRDTAALEPEHAACLAALRRALDRLPAGSFNVSVNAATSTRFTERWSGSGVEALADARVDAVRAALGLHPARPGMHIMVEGFEHRVPISSSEDPHDVARRRVVCCELHGHLLTDRRHDLDTVTAETLDLGALHTALRTSDMGDLFTDKHMGGATVRALLRRERRYLACLLAPQWVRPYPSWGHRASRLLRAHYDRRDDADKRRIRQLKQVAAIFGVRCEILALLRGLFGDRGGLHARLGPHRTKLDVSCIACFELLEVDGPSPHRLRTLASRLQDIDLDSDLGPAVVVAAAEAIAQKSLSGCHNKGVPLGWEEFCVAVARPQLSDLALQ